MESENSEGSHPNNVVETVEETPRAAGPGAMLNLINSESVFDVTQEDFEGFIDSNDLTKLKTDYSIVAIMGGQSGGKSTLLNILFGTRFEVLDSTIRRSATTKGIWLSRSQYSPDTLIMDLEGTDSDEKDEAAVETFARQASLFALAVAEVLIINVWAHDIGKRKAQNLLVLETIFEVNLSLFQANNDNKTILLFAIRDHIEKKNPLEVLKAAIMRNIYGIWEKIEKPQMFQNKKVEDIFQIEFVGLHHYDLQAKEFAEDTAVLKERFRNQRAKNYMFNNELHYRKSKGVPFSEFHNYVSVLWDTITTAEELNIVSQKEALTDRLCEKHMNEAYSIVQERTKEMNKCVEVSLITDFGVQISSLLQEAITQYDGSVFHSEQEQKHGSGQLYDIKTKRRRQLIENSGKDLQILFDRQMLHAKHAAIGHFTKSLEEGLPSDGSACSNFSLLKETSKTSSLRKFGQIEKASIIPDKFSWGTRHILADLEDEIAKLSEQTRKSQLECLHKEAEKRLKGVFAPQIAALAKKADMSLWTKVHEARVKATDSVNSLLDEKLPGFQCSKAEVQKAYDEMGDLILRIIRDKMSEQIQFIDQILLRRFDKIFRYDEEGLPRNWTGGLGVDVRELFKEAKDEALKLLDIYARFEIDGDEKKWKDMETTEKMFIKEDEIEEITTKFEQTITGALREAENQIQNAKTEIPIWLIVLLIAFGWNEITTVLYSPLYFVLCALAAMIIYVMSRLNLFGPVTMLLKQAIKQATEMAHNAINGPKEQAPQTPPTVTRRHSLPHKSDETVMKARQKSHRRNATEPAFSAVELQNITDTARESTDG